jgi:hypothetical protein
MNELKVVEWNINNRCGYGGYKFPDFVPKYLKAKNPDIIIFTEYIQSSQIEDNNGKIDEKKCEEINYNSFRGQFEIDYHYCECLGNKDNGVLICLKNSLFEKPEDSDLVKSLPDNLIERESSDTENDLRYVTPDFLHIKVKTIMGGIILNIIGVRIRTAIKKGENKDNPEIYKRRKKQFNSILNYIKENELTNVVMMGDFNNGNIKEKNNYEKTSREAYNYQMIGNCVENNQLKHIETQSDCLLPEEKYSLRDCKEDHIIVSKHLANKTSNVRYDWGFYTRHNYPDRVIIMPQKCKLPDHAILEATICLDSAKIDEYICEYTVYPYTNGGETHPDSHPEVKEFYKDKIFSKLTYCETTFDKDQNLLILKTSGKEIEIEGETFISINTILGCILKLSSFNDVLTKHNGDLKDLPYNVRLAIILSLSDLSENLSLSNEIKTNLEKMYHLYHTKGNFIPLPLEDWDKEEHPNEEIKSLNIFKNAEFNDFPDGFLRDIHDNFFSENQTKPHYEFAKSDINRSYFAAYGTGETGWKKFIETNLLEGYFEDTEYQKYRKVSCDKKSLMFRNNPNPTKTPAEQIEEISEFLKIAVAIIEARNERIAKA